MKRDDDAEMIRFIVDYRTEHQYPPSISEIVEHFGLARSTIQWHLDRMIREGKLSRKPGEARAIAILPAGMKLITSPLEQL